MTPLAIASCQADCGGLAERQGAMTFPASIRCERQATALNDSCLAARQSSQCANITVLRHNSAHLCAWERAGKASWDGGCSGPLWIAALWPHVGRQRLRVSCAAAEPLCPDLRPQFAAQSQTCSRCHGRKFSYGMRFSASILVTYPGMLYTSMQGMQAEQTVCPRGCGLSA